MRSAVAWARVTPAGRTQLAETAQVIEWTGASLVSACADGTVLVDGTPVPAHRPGSPQVVAMAFGPSWELASVDRCGQVRVGDSVQDLGGWGRHLSWTGMDRLVVVTSAGIHSGPIGGLRPVPVRTGHIRAACVLPGGGVVVGTTDEVVVVDLDRAVVDDRRPGAMACRFALHPAGDLLAVGDAAGSAHVVRLDSGAGVEIDGYGAPVDLLCWAGVHLVVVDGKAVTSWPVRADGKVAAPSPIGLVEAPTPVTALASPASAAVVAAGDAEGGVWLLAPDRTAPPLASLRLSARVVTLRWSADGARLAAGCADGSLQRYDVALA